MKIPRILAVSLAALALTHAASAADVTVHITGSSAFRAAASNAILNILNGGTTTFAYDGTSFTGATYQIFKGSRTGFTGTITVKTQWSGSVSGIRDVSSEASINFLKDTVTTSTSGTSLTGAAIDLTAEKAEVALADNTQAATIYKSPSINTTAKVGIVPFAFVASQNTPTAVTNVTAQLAKALLGAGTLPASLFTGVATDVVPIYAVGRDTGSGTRLTSLAETGYGTTNPVTQYIPTLNTTAGQTNTVASITYTTNNGNDGASSGGNVRDYLRYGTSNVSDQSPLSTGYTGPVGLIGYLGESDSYGAVFAVGGGVTGNGAGNARYLTYNGVAGFGGTAVRPALGTSSTVLNSKTLTVPSTAGLVVGQVVAGNGIAPGSTIQQIVDSTHILMDKNATAGGDPAVGNVTFQIGALLPAAIRNGSYSFWNYEYISWKSTVVNGDKAIVAVALRDQITTKDYGYSGLADDAAMLVARSSDGGAILVK